MKYSVLSSFAFALLARAEPRDELTPYKGECRAKSRRSHVKRTTRAICAQSSKLTKSDPSLNGVTGTNYDRCTLDSDYWIADADTVLAPLDALYNGTVHLVSRPPADSSCPGQESDTTYPYQLRIGSTSTIAGTNRTRSYYDANPFYMHLTYFNPKGFRDTSTQNMTTAGDVYMVSSQSYYEYGQHWTLNSTKRENGFDIAGTLTSHKYADYQIDGYNED